jgi:GntR family transcriptional regulator, rspAB operon transcriptional repressor
MTKDITPIYEDISNAIITLKLLPGEKISEIESSRRFNVSRTPIRDVFKRLEDNGLLEIRSQSGSFVTKINMANIADLVYIRNSCELSVLSQLAGKISKESADYLYHNLQLQSELSLMKNSSNEEFAAKYFSLDNDFHQYIFSLAGKGGVLKLLNSNQPNFQRYRFITFYRDEEDLKKLHDVHTRMVQALYMNETADLSEIVYEHNYSGLRGIEKVIEEHRDYFDMND